MGTRRLPQLLLGLFILVAAVALVAPNAFGAAERIEPTILGLPFAFAWYACWACATCVALLLYYLSTNGGRE